MRTYICHKRVKAAVIWLVDKSGNYPGREGKIAICTQDENGIVGTGAFVDPSFIARGEPQRGDYLVQYEPDGYLSWSPKAVFEAGYSLAEGIE